MKLKIDFDPKEHGYIGITNLKEALDLLNEVYGILWCEAHYDPLNKYTQEFSIPLAKKMQKVNDILKFRD